MGRGKGKGRRPSTNNSKKRQKKSTKKKNTKKKNTKKKNTKKKNTKKNTRRNNNKKSTKKKNTKKKNYGAERARRNKGRKAPYKKRAATPRKSGGSSLINITNLDHAVTEADVREIFSKIGKVKKAVVMYNAKGKSRGVALVTFANAASATKAVKEYHQAEVDGRPMYVKAVSYNTRPSTPKKKNTTKKKTTKKKGPAKKKKTTKKKSGKKGGRGRGRGRGRGGKGKKGSKKKRSKKKPKTVEELDQEMEDYYNKGTAAAAPAAPAAPAVDPIAAGQPDTAKLFSSDGAEE